MWRLIDVAYACSVPSEALLPAGCHLQPDCTCIYREGMAAAIRADIIAVVGGIALTILFFYLLHRTTSLKNQGRVKKSLTLAAIWLAVSFVIVPITFMALNTAPGIVTSKAMLVPVWVTLLIAGL